MLYLSTGFPTWISVSIAIILIGVTCFIIYYKRISSKWPPATRQGIIGTAKRAMDGYLPQLLLENANSVGPVFRLAIPTSRPVCCICDPVLARQLLETDSNKSEGYRMLQKLTFDIPNIMSKDTFHDGWEWARKGTAPSFSNINLNKTFPKLQQRLSEFVGVLDEYAECGRKFNLGDVLLKFTFNFIATSMFGVDSKIDLDPDSQSDASVLLRELHIMITDIFRNKLLRIDRLWNGEPARAALASKRMKELTLQMLHNFRKTHTAEELETDTSILAHLIRAPYENDEARCADMVLFLIAGHDTTAYTLAWTLIECSSHPEVVVLVRDELNRINPDHTAEFTLNHLSQMDYIVSVIKESMRLWPVVAIGSARKYDHDITVGDYVIPKESTIIFPFYPIFRHSGIQNAESFEPARWQRTDDQDTELLKTLFFPFSTGRRNCVGQNLAMLELKLVLATLLRRYDVVLESPADQIRPNTAMTMKPENAIVSLRKISAQQSRDI